MCPACSNTQSGGNDQYWRISLYCKIPYKRPLPIKRPSPSIARMFAKWPSKYEYKRHSPTFAWMFAMRPRVGYVEFYGTCMTNHKSKIFWSCSAFVYVDNHKSVVSQISYMFTQAEILCPKHRTGNELGCKHSNFCCFQSKVFYHDLNWDEAFFAQTNVINVIFIK